MPPEFCVVCGRTDRPLAEGVCAECYAATHELLGVVPAPRVVLCPTCGARQVGQHWERRGAPPILGAEDLAPLLRPHPEVGVRHVAWTETGGNPMLREVEGVAELRFRGTERTSVVRLSVKVEHRTCPECSRRSGHYYTALLQLRSEVGERHEPARALRERLAGVWDSVYAELAPSWQRAFSWREELPEGWDFYLTDTPAARAAARFLKARLGATLKESATLWGRRNGEDVYRVTFCLRLPAGLVRAPTRGPARRGRPPAARVERQS